MLKASTVDFYPGAPIPMQPDPSATLLTLAIVIGSLWLALDYGRQRSFWFAWLFALLALERLAALSATGSAVLTAGLSPTDAAAGLRLAITLIFLPTGILGRPEVEKV